MAERISLDEHQDSLLTDEERAAIADDPPGADAAAEDTAENASADADHDDDGDDDSDDDADGESAGDDDTKPVAEVAAPAAAAVADTADEDDEPALPTYQVALPEDFDAKVAANKAALTDLRKKRDDGEISNSEFDAQVETLSDERDELRRLQARHDVAEDMRQQSQQAQVNAYWGRTLKAAEADGIDYRTDKVKHADFDLMIKALANNPANNDRPLKWFFAEAHKRVLALHGVAAAASAPADPAAPVDKRKAAADARKPDLSALPKTLADVPGDDGPGSVDGDEFGDIDALDGLAYEDALAAKMKRDPGFATKYVAGVKGGARKAARAH